MCFIVWSLKREPLKKKTKREAPALGPDEGLNALILKLTSFDLDQVTWVSVLSHVKLICKASLL